MPKASDNFLRGWCRQVREALDDGTELGYEAAELLEELSELLVPGGAAGDEMVSSDTDGVCEDDSDTSRDAEGPQQMYLPGVSGVVGDMEHLRGRDDRSRSVPRGAGSGASVLTSSVKRVDRG